MIFIAPQQFFRRTIAILPFILGGLTACPPIAASADEGLNLPEVVNFNDHIREIFNKNCVACHGGVKQAGDLSFIYKDRVLPPDGWIVEPGDPDGSILIERILETDPDMQMPPPEHGPRLSDRDVAMLRKWIEQGAVWEASYWSYATPKPQTPPDVSDPSWPREPLDRFVMSQLDEKHLSPSDDASPNRWLRRVSLDLTGLPPSPQRQAAFAKDYKSDPVKAKENLVDALLRSPAYGERWASVWLDQIRYADSKGLGSDGKRSAWKFRDWVIDSLNDDLPYDEFTIKQIAGDLLPDPTMDDLIATAANRLTQTNEEGGTDDEEFRVAAVLDRVSTTWQTWMGVTFSCVQCHSHPYDAFEHDEFYQFAAFFNNTADSDLGDDSPLLQVPIDPKENEAANQLDHQIHSIGRELWRREYDVVNQRDAWKPITGLTAKTSNATRIETQTIGDHDEFYTVDTVSMNTDITLQAPVPDHVDRLTAIRLTIRPLDPEAAVADSEWGFVVSDLTAELIVDGNETPQPIELKYVVGDEPEPFFDAMDSLNPKSNRGFSAYSRIHFDRQAAFILAEPIDVPDNAELRVKLTHRVSELGAFALVSRRGHLAVSDQDRFIDLVNDPRNRSDRAKLAELKGQRSKIKTVSLPIMRERPEHLTRPMHVFERGLFLTKGDEVRPGTPKSLPPMEIHHGSTSSSGVHAGIQEGEPGKATRLDMAEWLVSPNNPLTARVQVNRMWAQLFGTGLVLTEEDFGSSGELPSHPQLLDYLALRFQNEMDWSMTSLLREIVLSRTYGQSSKATPENYVADPTNRWLSRGPRHRLTAEVVRDQALAVSGLLSDEMFGPPVHPPIPDGVWQPFQGGDKWNTPKPGESDRYRRSIYTYMKRSIPYPMFAAFDSPSREFCSPRRLTSNTPLQALMMLNDVTFAECASALAERMMSDSEDTRDQIRYGFKTVTSREPEDDDLNDLMALYQTKKQESDGVTDATAMTTVATVLLNLDEVVMK